MKNILFILLVALTISCHDQPNKMKNKKTYCVWTYVHEFGRDTSTGDSEEAEVLSADREFISSLPKELKIIVAYYSTRISTIVEVDSMHLAKSLGDFSSLEEAQSTLLKDWQYDETLPEPEYRNRKIAELYVMRSGTNFIFGYQPPRFTPWPWDEANADEFSINEEMKIIHIRHYDRNVFVGEDYSEKEFGYKIDYPSRNSK